MNPAWREFAPRLSDGTCEVTSSQTEDYNCLAFAAGVTNAWWEPYVIPPKEPGLYWPPGVHPDDRVQDWAAALATCGFVECADGTLDAALVKVVIYGRDGRATHAARQLRNGRWTSKLGRLEDVAHTSVDALGGGDYGDPVLFLSRHRNRPIRSRNPMRVTE